jgi:hypothetical protein
MQAENRLRINVRTAPQALDWFVLTVLCELLMQAVGEREGRLVAGDGAAQGLRLLLEGGRLDRGRRVHTDAQAGCG